MSTLDHKTIHTLVGIYNADTNEFVTEDNKYECICYRPVREAITNKLAAINLYYDIDIKCWVVFQYVLM